MSLFRRPALEEPDRAVARGVFLVVLAVYVVSFVGRSQVPAAEANFQSTSALARTGSLALGGTPEAERLIDLAGTSAVAGRPVRVVGEGDAKRAYGRSGIAEVVLALPFYYAGRAWASLAPNLEAAGIERPYDALPASESLAHLTVGLRNPIAGAGIAWLLVLVSIRLGVGRRRAALAALAFALTTFAWPQARASLSDVQATFFLLLAFHLVLVARERLDYLEMPPLRIALGIGCALAAAFLTRVALVPACIVVAALGEMILRIGHRRIVASRWTMRGRGGLSPRRALLFVLLPVLVGAGVFVATNLARFGGALDSGHGDPLAAEMFGGSPGTGLAGLLVSPGRGLLWMAPLVALAPFGALRALNDGERLIVGALGALAAAVALPAAWIDTWHGESTYGPRYLLPALPFLWVFVALALEEAVRHAWLRRAAIGLAGLGTVVALGGVVVDSETHRDLASQAAQIEWPTPGSLGLGASASPAEVERARFERQLYDVRLAAPLAHWRIFRHRVAGLPEVFPVSEIFLFEGDAVVSPRSERTTDLRHLGWLEFTRRYGGPALLPLGATALLILLGTVSLARGLDRAAT